MDISRYNRFAIVIKKRVGMQNSSERAVVTQIVYDTKGVGVAWSFTNFNQANLAIYMPASLTLLRVH